MSTDVLAAARELLAKQAALTQHFGVQGERIYADPDLPVGYTPEDGCAVTMNVRGGADDYSGKLLVPSIQFLIFGPTAESRWDAYTALRTALNEARSHIVTAAWMETIGQPVPAEPGGFPFVFTAWRFIMRDL